MGHKGYYGQYTGNAKWSKNHADTKVTKSNYKASERDDAAHIDYLKRDINYDNKHGHSDSSMTSDEKHISKLAGDMKYDKEHHGSPAHIKGSQKDHGHSSKEFADHEARVGTDGHSPVKHQGDGGHKKAFNYGDGKDNDRKKSHMRKTKHNVDGSHSNSIQANQKNRKAAPKMVSPFSHEREDKNEHLHASIKRKMSKKKKQ